MEIFNVISCNFNTVVTIVAIIVGVKALHKN